MSCNNKQEIKLTKFDTSKEISAYNNDILITHQLENENTVIYKQISGNNKKQLKSTKSEINESDNSDIEPSWYLIVTPLKPYNTTHITSTLEIQSNRNNNIRYNILSSNIIFNNNNIIINSYDRVKYDIYINIKDNYSRDKKYCIRIKSDNNINEDLIYCYNITESSINIYI